MTGTAHDGLDIVSFSSGHEWELWLETNHASSAGVWIRIAKKASGVATVTYPEAVETALCFGWIDGQRRGHDETWFLQRFVPRRPRSRWSQINREKAETLIADGRMRPSGRAEIERAREDGRWDAAYPGQAKMEVPEDLDRAVRLASAEQAFAALSSSQRFAVLIRLHHAKKPETRSRLIEDFVAGLANDTERR